MIRPLATPEELARLRNGDPDPASLPADNALPPQITDLANARRLVMTHGDDLRFAPELGDWLAWDGTRWAPDRTGEAARRAKEIVDGLRHLVGAVEDPKAWRDLMLAWQRSQQASRLDGMLRVASTEPGIPVLVEQLDVDPWLLNCPNGTIDLRTGDLRPPHREDLITKTTSAPYDPDAYSPRWEQFLHDVFAGDSALINFVQRALGYSITGLATEQALFVGHGGGANGKSTMLNLVRRILGDYGVQLAPDLLLASKNDAHPTGLTDLRGARFAATIEVEQGRRLAEALVKMLTGGETIRARKMHQNFFEFTPTHSLWLAVNHFPTVRGADLGIWRRVRVIPFTVTIAKDDQDPDLPEKLWAERAGILAWLVDGCLAWAHDGLQPPDTVLAATDRYREEQDHLGAFLNATYTLDTNGTVANIALRDKYEAWCTTAGEEPISKQLFGRLLTDRGYTTSRDRRRRHGLRFTSELTLNTEPER